MEAKERASAPRTERVLPGMKERGFGRFVHLLTTAIWGTPPPNVAGYVAAKSGTSAGRPRDDEYAIHWSSV